MIAACLAALGLSVAAALAGLGVLDHANVFSLPASTLRLSIAAIALLLAPLFWPGFRNAANAHRGVFAWSAAVVVLAAAAMLVTTGFAAPIALASTLSLLFAMLLSQHALAALIELILRRRATNLDSVRENACRAVVAAYCLAAALPLWFGPAAELLGTSLPWIVEATIAASPLTHLALGAGSDLFHTPWVYEHANLAVLQFQYPPLPWILTVYGALAAGSMLALAWLDRRDGVEAHI